MSEQKKSNQVAVVEKTPFERASELLKETKDTGYTAGVAWGVADVSFVGAMFGFILPSEVSVVVVPICLATGIGFVAAGIHYAKKATRQSNELQQIMKQQFKNG